MSDNFDYMSFHRGKSGQPYMGQGDYVTHKLGEAHQWHTPSSTSTPSTSEHMGYTGGPLSPEEEKAFRRIGIRLCVAALSLGALAMVPGMLKSLSDKIKHANWERIDTRVKKQYQPIMDDLVQNREGDALNLLNAFIAQSPCMIERTKTIFQGETRHAKPCQNGIEQGMMRDSSIFIESKGSTVSDGATLNLSVKATAYPLTPFNLNSNNRHNHHHNITNIQIIIHQIGQNKIENLMATRPGQCAIIHSTAYSYTQVTESNRDVQLSGSSNAYRLACADPKTFKLSYIR